MWILFLGTQVGSSAKNIDLCHLAKPSLPSSQNSLWRQSVQSVEFREAGPTAGVYNRWMTCAYAVPVFPSLTLLREPVLTGSVEALCRGHAAIALRPTGLTPSWQVGACSGCCEFCWEPKNEMWQCAGSFVHLQLFTEWWCLFRSPVNDQI